MFIVLDYYGQKSLEELKGPPLSGLYLLCGLQCDVAAVSGSHKRHWMISKRLLFPSQRRVPKMQMIPIYYFLLQNLPNGNRQQQQKKKKILAAPIYKFHTIETQLFINHEFDSDLVVQNNSAFVPLRVASLVISTFFWRGGEGQLLCLLVWATINCFFCVLNRSLLCVWDNLF